MNCDCIILDLMRFKCDLVNHSLFRYVLFAASNARFSTAQLIRDSTLTHPCKYIYILRHYFNMRSSRLCVYAIGLLVICMEGSHLCLVYDGSSQLALQTLHPEFRKRSDIVLISSDRNRMDKVNQGDTILSTSIGDRQLRNFR